VCAADRECGPVRGREYSAPFSEWPGT
jgi:hypothetical protein